jgi:hypothetical protein
MYPWFQRFRFSRTQLFVQAEDRRHERSFDRKSSSTSTTYRPRSAGRRQIPESAFARDLRRMMSLK